MESPVLTPICIETPVRGEFSEVFNRMDRELFEFLMPKYQPIRLLRFDGSAVGNEVHLRFGFPIFSNWVSRIDEVRCTDSECYFVDVGTALPFPLAHWKHIHRVAKRTEDSSTIIDEIYFSTGFPWFDRIFKPLLVGMFSQRIALYQKYFGTPTNS